MIEMVRLIRRIFFRNWGLKLFSFFLALFLWITLIPEEKVFSEKTLTVPLELHNIPPETEIVKKPPTTVDVNIRAPKRLLDQITPATVHAVLDLTNVPVDKRDYSLINNMISIPEGAEVKDIIPGQVTLTLERTKEILLDVEPDIKGKLPDGLKLEKIEVIPPQVPVRGPESKVTNNFKVKTEPVDVSSLSDSAEIEADLILPAPDLRLASPRKTVLIRLTIQEEASGEAGSRRKKD